jgi:hypothetical protein
VSCGRKEPAEALYEHFARKDAEFTLRTKDCNADFVKMFTAHPEQLIYLDTVSMKQGMFDCQVKLEYDNTEFDAAGIPCGTDEQVALQTLEQSLQRGETVGMMVILGGAQPTPEEYNKKITRDNYLAIMGLQSSQWQTVKNDFTDARVVTYTLEYRADTEEILQCRQAVADRIKELAGKLWQQDTPPQARVRAIHDYLINHTRYEDTGHWSDHTPYGPLLTGKGVCDGYTYAGKLLLDAAGIENYVVDGTAKGEPHSWNIVALGENYYHLDVTWDDPVDATGKQHLTYDYYLKGDADFLEDHVWNPEGLPDCEKNFH